MSDFTVRYCSSIAPQLVNTRLVFNPNYGGKPCSVPETCLITLVERQMKPKFFVALEANVKESGFRNPIVLYATPEGLHLAFGASRLRIAKKLDVPIPALVVDYVGTFDGEPEVTLDNYAEFFTDVPEYFEFTNIGIDTHYSLERNRRHTYDPAGFEWTKGKQDDFLSEEFPWLNEAR